MNQTDTSNLETDILVVGGGPTGLASALVAASHGHRVLLLAPRGTHVDTDARTTALMMPGIRMLQSLGVWDELGPDVAPLARLRIIDATGRLLRAPTVTFQANEVGEDAFGYNIPNRVLNAALEKAVDASDRIQRLDAMVSACAYDADGIEATLSDGRMIAARLAVAADGVQSLMRKAAGIGVRQWNYPQTAVVLAFSHQREHQWTSNEFHTPEGPFTQVPLPGGHRSSLVWVMRPERTEEFADLSQSELAGRIERQMQSMLGKITEVTKPQLWPLSSLVAETFAGQRLVLVGQAAHAFPPIGAQGLNLGFRDIEDLGSCLASHGANDPGHDAVTGAYGRKRRIDIVARTGAVDALNRSLLTAFLPAQFVRAAGLSVLKNIGPLRALFMREGMKPGSGLASVMKPREKAFSDR